MNNLKKILLLGLLSTGLFTSCKDNGSTSRVSKTWQVMTVSTSDIGLSREYPAVIRGRQDVEVRPQVSGTITRLCVSEGESVKQGQLLFVIDQTPYRAALRRATAMTQSAQAALATAQLEYESNRMLHKEQVISDYDLQKSHNTLSAAQAALSQAQAVEADARNNLSYTEIKSPSDGVVGNLPYRQGALVGPDIREPLTTVSDNSEMDVYFSIDENTLLAFIRQFGTKDSTLANMQNVSLMLSDGSMYEEKGRVESISGVVDRNTGSATLRARFPNGSRLLHSGTTGSIKLPSIYRGAIVIPQSATLKIQDKLIVYKVKDGKAVQSFIKVVPRNNGTDYVVTEGLTAGDIIIANGVGMVREGQQINMEGNGHE